MNPLEGAIDTHVHSAPDAIPRAQDDIELATAARSAGMRAVVLKSHHFPTADRALLAARHVEGISVIGGLVLNATSCGGLNADAVRTVLGIGGRVIWLPTISARNHLSQLRAGNVSAHARNLTTSTTAVGVVDDTGRPVPALDAILDAIAVHDAVLATGHVGPDETVAIVEHALRRGVRRIVVTHPELPLVGMDVATQRDLAAAGAMFERCYLNVLNGLAARAVLDTARAVGIASTIFATDLGQAANPPAVEGFRAYHGALAAAGLTDAEWAAATGDNPGRLLGLTA